MNGSLARTQPAARMLNSAVARTAAMPAQMKAPGTCGELIQGMLEGNDFLVNCPIDHFATATARPQAAKGLDLDDAERHDKVRRAAFLLAERHGLSLAHEVKIDSTIPRGKGMASSTADLTAAIAALCRSCHAELSYEETAALLAAVEPSDCVHYPGIAWVNHLTGAWLGRWSAPSRLRVIVVDGGGQIDTVGFDRARARVVYQRHATVVRDYLDRLGRGLCTGDLGGVGEAASRSARLSQLILPKVHFEDLVHLAGEHGALGINCAHSGTVLGVLYAARDGGRVGERLWRAVEDWFGSDVTLVGDFAVISGGCWEA